MELVARALNPTRQLKSDRHFTPPPGAASKGFFFLGEGGKKGRGEKVKRFDSKSSVHAVAYMYLAGSRLFFVISALTKQ